MKMSRATNNLTICVRLFILYLGKVYKAFWINTKFSISESLRFVRTSAIVICKNRRVRNRNVIVSYIYYKGPSEQTRVFKNINTLKWESSIDVGDSLSES